MKVQVYDGDGVSNSDLRILSKDTARSVSAAIQKTYDMALSLCGGNIPVNLRCGDTPSDNDQCVEFLRNESTSTTEHKQHRNRMRAIAKELEDAGFIMESCWCLWVANS